MARHGARGKKAAGLSLLSQQTGFQRLVGQYSQEAGIVIPGGWRSSPRLLAQYSPVGRPPRAEKGHAAESTGRMSRHEAGHKTEIK